MSGCCGGNKKKKKVKVKRGKAEANGNFSLLSKIKVALVGK